MKYRIIATAIGLAVLILTAIILAAGKTNPDEPGYEPTEQSQ